MLLRWRNAMAKSEGSGSKARLPAPACVIVAVRLIKPLRAIKGTKQSARPFGPLLLKTAPHFTSGMKHALKTHIPVCLHVHVFWILDLSWY